MTQSVVTAGMDFMTNGIIRPNGLTSTVSRETNHLKKSFSNNNVDLHKASKSADDVDAVATISSATVTTSDKSIETATSSSNSVIEIIDESRSPEQPQKTTEVDDDACIQSIMDLSLPSHMSSNGTNMDECKVGSFFVAADDKPLDLTDFSYNHPPMSPMTILRQSPTDPKWFEENVNDFSLSSFLGQLDSACDADKRRKSPNRDVSKIS